jgi:hypothetical protein
LDIRRSNTRARTVVFRLAGEVLGFKKEIQVILFSFLVILAAAAAIGGVVWRKQAQMETKLPVYGGFGLCVFLVLLALFSISYVYVSSGKFATLNRKYVGSSLPPGRFVGFDGELGPQARIITQGFHFSPFIHFFFDVNHEEVFIVPAGKCAKLSAKDGEFAMHGAAFAQPWPDEHKGKYPSDAEYFLKNGGQRGPQTSVLAPGAYTINPYLWAEPELVDATRIEQGTVGVVKSAVKAVVDFGPFKRPEPTDDTLSILTKEKLPQGSVSTQLAPVGGIGVWEEALPPNVYYINTDVYKVTMVPVVASVFEYKGGYKARMVDVALNDKGEITERMTEVEVQEKPENADAAILIRPEGWNVHQELRVQAQVDPIMAPFVVASLGLTEANASAVIEDRVVTPIVRSVVREVGSGASIAIKQQRAVLDADSKPVMDPTGEPQIETFTEFRPVKVMDLLENRSPLEAEIEKRSRTEAAKAGVSILEVRLSESSIPAELLIARKREQLAKQLEAALKQEEQTQTQRQMTEKAREMAQQQTVLVQAEIEKKAATEKAEARKIEGEGEKNYLTAIAEGQKAQAEALGPDVTAKLQVIDRLVQAFGTLAKDNPAIFTEGMKNAHKFVPQVVVNNGNGGSGLEGAAAIFGNLMTPQKSEVSTVTAPVEQK